MRVRVCVCVCVRVCVLDSKWKKPISLTSTLADWMVAMTEFCVAVTADRVAG